MKKVVWRKKQNKGGAFINPRWGLYIYIYKYAAGGELLLGVAVQVLLGVLLIKLAAAVVIIIRRRIMLLIISI